MTLPLDTHLENSRSHYYEFPAYIDPIFIAIVPRFQETLATLMGIATPIVRAYNFITTAHHNTGWAVHCPPPQARDV